MDNIIRVYTLKKKIEVKFTINYWLQRWDYWKEEYPGLKQEEKIISIIKDVNLILNFYLHAVMTKN
jgi:hypothetical protein